VTRFPEELVTEIREEFPRFRIIHKAESPLSRWIDRVLRWVTLGGMRSYLTHYHTVIGYTLYVPDSWETTAPLEKVITLRHERVHLRQRKRYGLPLMAFLYLVPLFPIGLAYGRARLEWEAYEETLRATAELCGMDAARALEPEIVRRFTSSDYGWMWPFPQRVETWYAAALTRLAHENEHSKTSAST